MAKTELEKRILAWDREMWGGGPPHEKLAKLKEEFAELLDASRDFHRAPDSATRKALADEAADVVICLTAMLGRAGLSLQRSVEVKWAEVVDRTNGIGKPIKP